MRDKGRFHPFESLCTALSLYSRIPVPRDKVSSDGYRYALCFFPCIGVLIGLLTVLFYKAAAALSLSPVAFCAVAAAIPLIITGGIHMDGFLDTADALSSFSDKEKMREILKDPHIGAFAFIWGSVYILLYLAALAELDSAAFPAIAGIFVLSRALSAYSVVSFKKAEGPGMVKSLSEQSDTFAVKSSAVVWGAAAAIFIFFTASWMCAFCILAVALISLAACHELAERKFGGMSGDLAGFFLQVCELLLLAVLAVFH